MADETDTRKSTEEKIIDLLLEDDGEAEWVVAERAIAFKWHSHANFKDGAIEIAAHPKVWGNRGEFGEADNHWLSFRFKLDDVIETYFAKDGLEQIAAMRAELDRIERVLQVNQA
ncbi:hypothetical protein HRJ34_15545 [Rhizorhabdus wittichii]|uniref:Uncharacterized protein n=1 Tax=Rhizorhabdus wittichii TaxID=160791 RepID=A0A975CZA8_9SPHN|nr:hypothetical protein [Rhizorhabdus wittichii]QTH19778.1 hypothetical protein HRJ34_15545 [Rhizorhabdus wittichii]